MEYNAGFARPTSADEDIPVFIFSAGFDYSHNKEVNRINGFPFRQFLQCVKGSGILTIDGKEYTINKDTAFILPKNVPHKYIKTSDEWLLDWIVFSGSCLESIIEKLLIPSFAVYENKFSHEIHNTIQKIIKLYQKKPMDRVMRASAESYETLLKIKSLSGTRNRLSPVTEYIYNHISEEISLKNLSDTLKVTPEHLCRLFKSEFNMRPFEFVNRERIHLSKHLLFETDLNISEISYKCGFSNENYFRETFKKLVGVSPSRYRNSLS